MATRATAVVAEDAGAAFLGYERVRIGARPLGTVGFGVREQDAVEGGGGGGGTAVQEGQVIGVVVVWDADAADTTTGAGGVDSGGAAVEDGLAAADGGVAWSCC